MTGLSFEVALTKTGENSWTSSALGLPDAYLANVSAPRVASVKYHMDGRNIVVVGASPTRLTGQVVLPHALVAASALEETKVDLEREKVRSEDRANRRTVWVSVATAIIAAAATLGVALIANSGQGASPTVPSSYRDLVECRQSLNRLTTLSANVQQTLKTLQDAVTLHAEACDERLDTAITAAAALSR